MEFADSYFEDEVRDGYYIPSIIKKAWAAEQEVLAAFQEICDRHQIEYFAEWGTLLGVIRHGGMIPWDDDLDVCMKSSEFRKFMSVADELPEGCSASDYHLDDSSEDKNMVAKIINYSKVIVPDRIKKNYHGFPYVVALDIFPLDYLPPDREEEESFRYLFGVIGRAIDEVTKERKGEEINWEKVDESLEEIEQFFHMKFDRKKSLEIQLYDIMMELLPSLYTEQEAKELTHLALWTSNEAYRLPKSCFAQSIKVPFENMEIRVPVGYEELLRKKYGTGYMDPVRSGGSHGYPYFKQIEDVVRKKDGVELFEYNYSLEEIKQVELEREKERSNKQDSLLQQTKSFLPLFKEAHSSLLQIILEGDVQIAIGLLSECQNVAIELGQMLEEERGEGLQVVKILEHYCEQLYCISQELLRCDAQQLDTVGEVINKILISFEEDIEKVIEEELREKKEIVFVPYKAEYWGTMQKYWEEVKEDEDYEVYVIPAPYYYKDDMGDAKMNELQYELQGYPSEVIITSYEEYNFQAHHPDTIVIQCPYDDYNYAIQIHPFFFVTNIKRYCENLVYIPGLIMGEVRPDDERMRTVLRYYCNTPGVIHADRVIVQSEQMKEVYVELLTKFAGEDTKEIWEKKIESSKTPMVYDYETNNYKKREQAEVPDAWLPKLKKATGEWKKIILYTTSGGVLRMTGEKAVEKMERVFQIFEQNRDEVVLLWRPDPSVKEMIRKSNPGVWQKYRDFMQKYRESGLGILDDLPTPNVSIALCDACYGDGGSTMNTCREWKKPVMIQNVDC